jgi:hypothetical protein
MSQHFIKYCSCGKVISQCRCPSPSKTKTIIESGCHDCKAKADVENNTRISGDDLSKRLKG